MNIIYASRLPAALLCLRSNPEDETVIKIYHEFDTVQVVDLTRLSKENFTSPSDCDRKFENRLRSVPPNA